MAAERLAAAASLRPAGRACVHATLLGDVSFRRVVWLEDDLLGLLAGRPLMQLHLGGISHLDTVGAHALTELIEHVAEHCWSVALHAGGPVLRALDEHELFERRSRLFVPDGPGEPRPAATAGVLGLAQAAASGRACRGAYALRSDALWSHEADGATGRSGCAAIIDGLHRQLHGRQVTHAVETEGMVLTHAAPPGDVALEPARHLFWTTADAHIAVIAQRRSPARRDGGRVVSGRA